MQQKLKLQCRHFFIWSELQGGKLQHRHKHKQGGGGMTEEQVREVANTSCFFTCDVLQVLVL